VKVLTVFGTRPEAIKMAPLVQALASDPSVQHVTCVTGQHRQMLDQVLGVFAIRPEHDLDLMKCGQDLAYLTTAVLDGVGRVLQLERPDWLVVQGDTTTAFAAALAGFYRHVPVAHVEAGLRTHNPLSPWPEEMNRRLVASLASLHCAPTQLAADNLSREAVPSDRIVVTGNTVIDALRWTAAQAEADAALAALLTRHAPALLHTDRRLLLVTLHRRENLGERLRSICEGLRLLARRDDLRIAFPVHLNPQVRTVVDAVLLDIPTVHLLPPMAYLPFVALMRRCALIVTDSGGIQEEAAGLGKPVLVARDATERQEAIDAGTAELAGTDGPHIAGRCARLLDDPVAYARMAQATDAFGDGRAAPRIVAELKARWVRARSE